MRESKQASQMFTIFVNREGVDALSAHFFCGEHPSLEAAIVYATNHKYGVCHGWLPFAWSAEPVVTHGGSKWVNELISEALAAGRLIEKIDGKWVALGVEKPEAFDADIARLWAEACAPAPANPAFDATFDANARMIARDGPAKPAAVVLFKPAEPTAKPAISGLQRVYSHTHLLGSYR